jgi:hypothetical protein
MLQAAIHNLDGFCLVLEPESESARAFALLMSHAPSLRCALTWARRWPTLGAVDVATSALQELLDVADVVLTSGEAEDEDEAAALLEASNVLREGFTDDGSVESSPQAPIAGAWDDETAAGSGWGTSDGAAIGATWEPDEDWSCRATDHPIDFHSCFHFGTLYITDALLKNS